MQILGIETSCDDTGIAVLEIRNQKIKLRSNVVSSQVKLHAKYGGVYPLLAKREHQKNLPVVLKQAMQFAKIHDKDIDLISITVGPGLEPCLWVGLNFAKALAEKIKSTIVPVNHIEGHILANFFGLNSKLKTQSLKLFPAIALAVSGGHTQLILMRGIGKYKLIGQTRDDAAGECFDKTARILGLEYPGGPAIAEEAKKFKSRFKSLVHLPRPMIYQKNYDFSFSGLKTAVLYHYQSQPLKIRKSKKYIQTMAAEIQQAIIDVLIHKTIKAVQEYKAKTIMLGGGVAANNELRKQFKLKIRDLNLGINFLAPPKNLCTDNGAMIALAGYFKWLKNKKKKWKNIVANANLTLK